MANKDSEARALLEALCVWIVDDMHNMPIAATTLRARFDAAIAAPGTLQRERADDKRRDKRDE